MTFFYIGFFYVLLRKPISVWTAKIKVKLLFDDADEIQEYFKPYFENLSATDIQWSIKHESQCRQQFGYACKPDITHKNFKNSQLRLL